MVIQRDAHHFFYIVTEDVAFLMLWKNIVAFYAVHKITLRFFLIKVTQDLSANQTRSA